MQLYTELLPHQVAAVEKLSKLKIGALYMEMGTGKTRTALELIKQRLDAGKVEYIIWLCPCSVKANLLIDIRKHSDFVDGPLTICGIETLSSSIRENVRLLKIVESKKVYLIVDESNLVKNPEALRSKNITRIAEKCRYKLILNGTPVTKYEADLFSQWYLLDWRILGYKSFWSFAANHIEYDEKYPERIRKMLNIDYLVQKIEPYTYQIKKSECFILPAKNYSTEHFKMTEEQDKNYEYVIDRLLTNLDEMRPESIYRLFGALQAVTSGFAIRVNKDLETERFPLFIDPGDNPRIQTLLKLLEGKTDKYLIFCNYVQEIKDIATLLNSMDPGCAIPFYGEIPQNKRQNNIDQFRNDAQFLVANKRCGAYGLNLQFCHNIIYYSHDWDWGTRAQSEDRVHRFGQDHIVNIIDICASGSLDHQILKCLWRKENLVDKFKREIEKQKGNVSLRKFVHGDD